MSRNNITFYHPARELTVSATDTFENWNQTIILMFFLEIINEKNDPLTIVIYIPPH